MSLPQHPATPEGKVVCLSAQYSGIAECPPANASFSLHNCHMWQDGEIYKNIDICALV